MVEDASSRDYEEYKAFYDKQNSFTSKLTRSIKFQHLILFIILAVIGYMIWNQEGTNKNSVVMVIGGIVALVLILSMKQSGKVTPIPENVAWMLAQKELNRKVANGQITTGTEFNPTNISNLSYWGESHGEPIPHRWKLLFIQKNPDGLEEKKIFKMHPFFGYCIGIVSGTEKDLLDKDYRFILPEYQVAVSKEEKK